MRSGGPFRSAPLVGRAAELAELEAELEESLKGRFRCLLLSGEPGVGKTRLAHELLDGAGARFPRLVGAGGPFGGTAAYELWGEALDSYLRSVPPDQIARLCGGFVDDLAVLSHRIAAVAATLEGKAEPPRPRLLAGLAELLQNLSAQSPLVVFLDDAHLADPSSWHALDYLGRNLGSARCLVVLAARTGELSESLLATDVVLRLEQQDRLQRLELRPLSEAALEDMAAAVLGRPRPPRALVDWLVRHSRGNPLIALGLLRAVAEEGGDPEAPELTGVPVGLRTWVWHLLGRLESESLAAVEALAVGGEPLQLEELAPLMDDVADRLGEALERAVVHHLVVEEDAGGRLTYRIAHPLIQEAIYEGLPPTRRRQLHRRLAGLLAAEGRLGRAASHHARSARPGDPEAIDGLLAALRQAERQGTLHESLAILGSLVDFLPRGDSRWLNVLDTLDRRAEWLSEHRADADSAAAIQALRRARDLLPVEGEPLRRAILEFRLSGLLAWGAGQVEEGRPAGRTARDLFLAAGEPHQARIVEVELAWLSGLQHGYGEMEDLARSVAEAAEETGDEEAAVQAWFACGCGAIPARHYREGERALRRSIALATKVGNHYREVAGLAVLASALAWSGRTQEALAVLEEAGRCHPDHPETVSLEIAAQVRWMAGDLNGVLEAAHACHAHGVMSRRKAWVLALGAMAAAELGRFHEARPYLELAQQVYRGRPFYLFSEWCDYAEGLVTWHAGDPSQAVSVWQEAVDHIHLDGSFFLDLAEAGAQIGERSAVERAAAALARMRDESGAAVDEALAELATARLQMVDGLIPDLEAVGRATQVMAETGRRLDHARALMVFADAAAWADRSLAIELFTQAEEQLRACGARIRRQRVLDRLRELGKPGRRAVAALLGLESLTPREHQVVALAVEGHTAREIGTRLFISPRTVESHLSMAYAKLGVRSRVDLVRKVLGLAHRD
jgi:DNA-binding CsgD family transcriptional regulator